MTKEQRKIKELTAQVEDLTKKLTEEKGNRDYYSREYSKAQDELRELHTTFDLLNVPKKNPSQSYSFELSLSSRMTLYVAGVRNPKIGDVSVSEL